MPILLPVAAAYALFFACLLGVLLLHGVPALLAGLLSYSLTRALLAKLRKHFRTTRGLDFLAALTVGLGALAVISAIAAGVAHYLKGDSIPALMLTLADTLQHVRHYLPASLAAQIPDSWLEIKSVLASALKEHANTIASFGSMAVQQVVWLLIGWLVGVMLGSQPDGARANEPAFSASWLGLWRALGNAFSRVAFAQTKIAALNAGLTGAFLLGVLPLVGWQLPYATTLVFVTFVCGLMPIIGNLVSNALLCTLALSVAFPAALASLGFLVVIHKLEYFLNARIQGVSINAHAWELLIVLFVAERLFGPAGMVAAPIIYAFATGELRRAGWLNTKSA